MIGEVFVHSQPWVPLTTGETGSEATSAEAPPKSEVKLPVATA